jgi:polysaccharide biosynthesis protein PslH
MSGNPDPNQPNLLFLTPTLPHTTGTGSAIRAGLTLQSLARHFNVYVLHVELWGWHRQSFNTDFVHRHATRYVYYVPENGEVPMPRIMADHFSGIRFEAVHTFRMVMARAAVSLLQQTSLHPEGGLAPLNVIDLDDDEYQRSERFLQLREEAGETQRASSERRELPQLRLTERMLIPRFQTVCLAAGSDCDRVSQRHPAARVVHLPNAIFLPQSSPVSSPARPPTLLFVGTLDYLPNEDGIHHFCTHILPLIRQKSPGPIRVRVVGAHPRPRVRNLANEPDVEVLANVPDLAPYYADADAVIVPLRAGSGTRIKILEAFSFRKPVVSTSIGAEGLAVSHGRHLLIADEPQAFADACLRLINDPALRLTVVQSAWQWLLENHSIENFDSVICGLYESVLRRGACSAVTSDASSSRVL